MDNRQKVELLHRIELLQQRIQELELKEKSNENGFNSSTLVISPNPRRHSPLGYLISFTKSAAFPLVAGMFRAVYRLVHRSK